MSVYNLTITENWNKYFFSVLYKYSQTQLQSRGSLSLLYITQQGRHVSFPRNLC